MKFVDVYNINKKHYVGLFHVKTKEEEDKILSKYGKGYEAKEDALLDHKVFLQLLVRQEGYEYIEDNIKRVIGVIVDKKVYHYGLLDLVDIKKYQKSGYTVKWVSRRDLLKLNNKGMLK